MGDSPMHLFLPRPPIHQTCGWADLRTFTRTPSLGITRHMDGREIFQICLLFLGIHVLAVPAFIWAVKHRQFRAGETVAQVPLGDEPDYTGAVSIRPASRAGAWVVFTVITVLFLPLVLLTARIVVEASRPGVPPSPSTTAAPVAKCPF